MLPPDPAPRIDQRVRAAVVDGSAAVAYLVAATLEAHGAFEVVRCMGLDEIGSPARSWPPVDLAVVDVDLRHRAALACLRAVRRGAGPDAVVALVAGDRISRAHRNNALASGVDTVLAKACLTTSLPYELAALVGRGSIAVAAG